MIKKVIGVVLSLSLVLSLMTTVGLSASADEFTKTSYEFSKQFTVGINIGNTLDTCPGGNETGWGCPMIEDGLIKAYKAQGFDIIRVPVTWSGGSVLNADGTFADRGRWLNRVKTVCDLVLNNGLYCIVNTHHEMGWLRTFWDNGEGEMDEAKEQAMYAKERVLWTNIAEKFKDYGEKLIFEAYNETRADEGLWSGTPDDRVTLKNIGQIFIDTVRATGSNNAKRYLLLNTYAGSMAYLEVKNFQLATDPVNHVMVGVHAYFPSFCTNTSLQFSQTDFDQAWNKCIDQLVNRFLKNNVGVILGEFGALQTYDVSKRAARDADRVKYMDAVAKKCMSAGMVPIVWENYLLNINEPYGLIDRNSPYEWYSPNVVNELVNKCKAYSPLRPDYNNPTTTTTTKPITTTTTTTKPQPHIIEGDINGDGVVNVLDVRMLVNGIMSGVYTNPTAEQLAVADLNKDKVVNTLDARQLLAKIL